ncbi:hypothetical protein WGT02_13705 [Rhizobium sp. T1470]|uniref:hypothetical protein n=1 Tax=unclassified Rhizobium TaxID=2613769 RepID=UPI001AAE4963|nr:hypothetical protein [Rhizobium sp. T1473]MCA0802279.1 hypothetical protein [Rhizobium sp. T1473]
MPNPPFSSRLHAKSFGLVLFGDWFNAHLARLAQSGTQPVDALHVRGSAEGPELVIAKLPIAGRMNFAAATFRTQPGALAASAFMRLIPILGLPWQEHD